MRSSLSLVTWGFWSEPESSGRKDGRVGTVICGWTLERALAAGRVCESWLATKAGADSREVEGLRLAQ